MCPMCPVVFYCFSDRSPLNLARSENTWSTWGRWDTAKMVSPECGSEVDPHAIPAAAQPSPRRHPLTVAPFHQVNLPRTSQADVDECLRLRRVEADR